MCNCIDDVNRHLAKYNTQIMMPIWVGSGDIKPFVETEKIDMKKRGKPRRMFAAHCPFCGAKYKKVAETDDQGTSK